MEEIKLSYPKKNIKIQEIWIDLSKQNICKIKESKIKTIQIPDISNFLKFWNSSSKHKVRVIWLTDMCSLLENICVTSVS